MSKAKNEDQQEEINGSEPTQGDSAIPVKTAFIITPVGPNNSDIRRAANGVIDAVIEPILEANNIKVIVPHRMDDIGSITNQVINSILNADIVIANLTGLNPNVMYELAIRHAKRLPVIIIAEQGTKLPFDITTERTFFYTNDMADVLELKKQLAKTIPLALKDKMPSNPIYNAVSEELIKEKISKDGDDFQRYVLAQLRDLNSSISLLAADSSRRSITSRISFSSWYLYKIDFGSSKHKDTSSEVIRILRTLFQELNAVELTHTTISHLTFTSGEIVDTGIINSYLRQSNIPVHSIQMIPTAS